MMMTVPATDNPIEMRPSFLARGGSNTASRLATTVQTCIMIPGYRASCNHIAQKIIRHISVNYFGLQ